MPNARAMIQAYVQAEHFAIGPFGDARTAGRYRDLRALLVKEFHS